VCQHALLLLLQVTHAIRYPAPVLSMGISPDCSTLVVGMVDGLLSVKRHAKPPPAPESAGMASCLLAILRQAWSRIFAALSTRVCSSRLLGIVSFGLLDFHTKPDSWHLPWRAGVPARRVRYKPRLTAASYRYFLRGANEKAAADDFRVAARRRARLAPFDRALRQFRCEIAMHGMGVAMQPPLDVSSPLDQQSANQR